MKNKIAKKEISITEKLLNEVKNHMSILVEGLRDEVSLVAEGVLGNTQSIGRLEAQVDRVEQDVSVLKTDVDILKINNATKDDLKSTEDRLTKKIENSRNESRKEIIKLNKEVFGQ